MNSIKLQSIINSLEIDYQRGKSLLLKVSEAEQKKQKRFWFWTVLLIISSFTLILFLVLKPNQAFKYPDILLVISAVLNIMFSIIMARKNYNSTKYTFKKIKFTANQIEVVNRQTSKTIQIKRPLEYKLILNQNDSRPIIQMNILNTASITFQLDSMQDFPIVTDAIADILNTEFKAHQAINDFTEELTFINSAI